jgi:hypothetical protein
VRGIRSDWPVVFYALRRQRISPGIGVCRTTVSSGSVPEIIESAVGCVREANPRELWRLVA